MATARRVTELAAGADEVWAVVGDFNGLPEWLPPIERSELEDGGVRRLTLRDGGEVVERLESHDDAGRSYSYRILESGLPVRDYRATVAVHERPDGCEVEWQSTFEPEGASEEDAVAVIDGIYDTGLAALRERFGA